MDRLEDVASNSTCASYEEELRKVNASLETVEDEEVKAMLLDLKKSLTEVLSLEKTLKNKHKEEQEEAEDDKEENVENYLEAEERRFKEELALLEQEQNMPKTHENLKKLAGELCQAPHKHSWGSMAYHNALIASIHEAENENGLTEKHVRVFFTNPTHREMLPCEYYLEGNCRFNDDNCYFSHGEVVSASSLREYMAPDFERLSIKCVVLAKLDDKLWHLGRVTSIDMDNKKAAVILNVDKSARSILFENLLPIVEVDESDESTSGFSDSEGSDETEDEKLPLAEKKMPNQNIMSIRPMQALGEWEKHTRGIGSKLMAKMGYIHGNALGTNGEGIIVPISAQILPPGRSLDVCMKLREKANGDKDLFNVERKINRDKKKQEQNNARAYERECKRTDVFSFLNDSVLNQRQEQTQKLSLEPSTSQNAKRQLLQKTSTKILNVANMKVCDDIRRKTREINKMEEMFNRQTSGTESFKRLQSQINDKNRELNMLKSVERHLCNEQASRQTTAKSSIF